MPITTKQVENCRKEASGLVIRSRTQVDKQEAAVDVPEASPPAPVLTYKPGLIDGGIIYHLS